MLGIPNSTIFLPGGLIFYLTLFKYNYTNCISLKILTILALIEAVLLGLRTIAHCLHQQYQGTVFVHVLKL